MYNPVKPNKTHGNPVKPSKTQKSPVKSIQTQNNEVKTVKPSKIRSNPVKPMETRRNSKKMMKFSHLVSSFFFFIFLPFRVGAVPVAWRPLERRRLRRSPSPICCAPTTRWRTCASSPGQFFLYWKKNQIVTTRWKTQYQPMQLNWSRLNQLRPGKTSSNRWKTKWNWRKLGKTQ